MPISRRAFIQSGVLMLLPGCAAPRAVDSSPPPADPLRVGLLTDLHYADKPPAINRHYRQAIDKLHEAVDLFNAMDLSLAIELGDIVDQAPDVETELGYLKAIEAAYARFRGERHYVLGNHCVATLTKQEFFSATGAQQGHGSFDHDGFHFVILDACYTAAGEPYGRNNSKWDDANIPDEQLRWLESDLAATAHPAIVCVHQRLDVEGPYAVKNAPAVRAILEKRGNVRAVLQGHYHKNDYRFVNGIHYCVLRAMVEGDGPGQNGYCVMHLHRDGVIRIEGYRQQSPHYWPAGADASLPSTAT